MKMGGFEDRYRERNEERDREKESSWIVYIGKA